ncbi:metallophosphoesterase [Lacticaseibacillus paracasei]|uniref:metallophosphoesterase n=1 Tax=Lacticaseibacillus paracasei TaxID=1597 RepID=UPI00194DB17D|nr:metallophosphoesterase [Lacticaseibacillus paracasei]MBM6642190.1 metallophosphoesterase [Lacticaseibacillus paracasei]
MTSIQNEPKGSEYRDPSHIKQNNEIQDDIDKGVVDPKAKTLSGWIQHKQYGLDVRKSLSLFTEWISSKFNAIVSAFENVKDRQDHVEGRQDDVEDQFKDVVANATKDSEVILARDSKFYGKFSVLDDRLENVETYLKGSYKNLMTVDDALMIGKPVKNEDVATLQLMHDNINQTLFNMAMITDVHYGNWANHTGRNNPDTIGHLSNVLFMDDKVDAIVSGGDNCDGLSESFPALLNEQRAYANKMIYSENNHADKFIQIGNHDDGSGRAQQQTNGNYSYRDLLVGENGYQLDVSTNLTKNDFKRIYHTADDLFGETRNEGSNYFFKDYPEKKIRLIGLDSCDVPDIKLDNGLPKYPQIVNMGFQQEQINWLANVALMAVPAGYAVILVSHIPAGDTSESQHNQPLVSQVVKAFMDGKDITASSNEVDFQVNVSTHFSQQGPRDVAAYLYGHLHKEVFDTNQGFNAIGITSSICDPAIGNSDGWDIISVDPVARKVIIKGFGRATDRTYGY